ncbi:MAG: c-type cytochrome [Acidobacteria bacterium]|nr:c-type cytochrome [Acidobacteriota bacterium]
MIARILQFSALCGAVAGVVVACRGGTPADSTPGVLPYLIAPTRTLASSPALLALGQKTFEKECAACHGPNGDGEGAAAYLLYPRPRDFTAGQFRIISTWDGVPTDEDLYRTISRGMPGSAMPSWAHLPEETRWGLVHYVKSFSKRPMTLKASHEPDKWGSGGAGVIGVPPEPAYDADAKIRAQELFAKGCAPCHGATARGDGAQKQVDSKGYPTRPRDLTLGVFKGNPLPTDVYRRIVAGLPGSPMPQSGYLQGNDGWHLTHFVRSLSSDAQRDKVEMKRFRIVAKRVAALPAGPDAGGWRDTAAVNIHLMPLWWRTDRPEEITVRALHDGKSLAVLLKWEDTTYDATAIRPQDFRDAAAVEFALTPDPPFFAMGQSGQAVNIWMWKAERQADLEPAFQDLEKVYPHIGIDSYPNLLKSPFEQPMRNALTLESDPRFVTAWGAGNIVADPTRRSAAEDLSAQGFGTLRARPPAAQAVTATGEFATGSYLVQFTRPFAAGDNAVRLSPGSTVPVAFAVWNGAAGDRDGKKSVTIWQELLLEK